MFTKLKCQIPFCFGTSPSLRIYLMVMNLLLLGILFPVVSTILLYKTTQFQNQQSDRNIEQMQRSLEGRATSLMRSMSLSANQAVAGYDFVFLNTLTTQVVRHDDEIDTCSLTNQQHFVVAHSDPLMVGTPLSGAPYQQAAALMASFPTLLKMGEDPPLHWIKPNRNPGQAETAEVMDVAIPIYNGLNLWGVLRCGYSLRPLHRTMQQSKQEWSKQLNQFILYFVTIFIMIFFMGFVVATVFTRTLVRAINTLSNSVQRVTKGDLQYRINSTNLTCVEFIQLSQMFNDMTQALQESHRKLDDYSRSLADKVEERTRELHQVQNELLKQAHEAGMAEIAVGVLHNIGNAITPAKISVSMLLKHLQHNPLRTHLEAALAPIAQALHQSQTLAAIEQQRLVRMISVLPRSIREDYDHILNELNKIRIKQEHIESIITLQMRYANLIRNPEKVLINPLLSDAIKMLEESLQKRNVQITTHFAQLPTVCAEETKLLQVFINLIKNAFEAMDELAVEQRQMTITTRLEPGSSNSPSFVVVSIRDQGMGFNPLDKQKLFAFGYSSKARGSGFGLHSCANYVIANHGLIDAHSDGPGQGAEFIVKLPVDPVD